MRTVGHELPIKKNRELGYGHRLHRAFKLQQKRSRRSRRHRRFHAYRRATTTLRRKWRLLSSTNTADSRTTRSPDSTVTRKPYGFVLRGGRPLYRALARVRMSAIITEPK